MGTAFRRDDRIASVVAAAKVATSLCDLAQPVCT